MPKKKSQFTDADDALLEELGVEVEVKKAAQYTKEEERVMAGFEEIQRFVEEHGRSPQHGEDKDIFERLYAVRLDRLSELGSCHELLQPMDRQGLLNAGADSASDHEVEMDDDALLEALGVEAQSGSVEELKHVRPSKEIRAAEEVAQRERCEDFDQYKELFDQVKEDLEAGTRQMIRCDNKTDVKIGDLLVLKGQTAYIANAGEEFTDDEGERIVDLSVILVMALKVRCYADPFKSAYGKTILLGASTTPSDLGPMFTDQVVEEDRASGTIYVLRSQSEILLLKSTVN